MHAFTQHFFLGVIYTFSCFQYVENNDKVYYYILKKIMSFSCFPGVEYLEMCYVLCFEDCCQANVS